MLLNGSCGQYRLCIKRNLLFRFGACLHTQQTRRRPNAGPMLAHRLRRWPSFKPAQNICITFVQCVGDVGPALDKCYTNVLCLLGIAVGLAAITSRHGPDVC